MFGLGIGELFVILVVALLVFGPKRLPELASGLGKAIRDFRKATRDLQNQIEIDDEVKRPIQELRAALRDEPGPFPPLPVPTRAEGAVPQQPVAAVAAPDGAAAVAPALGPSPAEGSVHAIAQSPSAAASTAAAAPAASPDAPAASGTKAPAV